MARLLGLLTIGAFRSAPDHPDAAAARRGKRIGVVSPAKAAALWGVISPESTLARDVCIFLCVSKILLNVYELIVRMMGDVISIHKLAGRFAIAARPLFEIRLFARHVSQRRAVVSESACGGGWGCRPGRRRCGAFSRPTSMRRHMTKGPEGGEDAASEGAPCCRSFAAALVLVVVYDP